MQNRSRDHWSLQNSKGLEYSINPSIFCWFFEPYPINCKTPKTGFFSSHLQLVCPSSNFQSNHIRNFQELLRRTGSHTSVNEIGSWGYIHFHKLLLAQILTNRKKRAFIRCKVLYWISVKLFRWELMIWWRRKKCTGHSSHPSLLLQGLGLLVQRRFQIPSSTPKQ